MADYTAVFVPMTLMRLRRLLQHYWNQQMCVYIIPVFVWAFATLVFLAFYCSGGEGPMYRHTVSVPVLLCSYDMASHR